MDEARRVAVYLRQTGRATLTRRQARQVRRKHHNDTRTAAHIRRRQDQILAAISMGDTNASRNA